jgi:hypothetical protein
MIRSPSMRRVVIVGLIFALSVLSALAETPPKPAALAAPQGIRFMVGGDSRNDSVHVIPWAFKEAKARGATAFFFLGDMELSPELDSNFEKELTLLDPIPFYPALGNHEIKQFGALAVGQSEAERKFCGRFLGTKRTPVHSSLEGRVAYSVDLAGVHFVLLDNVSQNGFGADQLTWLASDLEHARGNPATKYILVGMHKPLAGNGISTHGMDSDGVQAAADSAAALALFQKWHVSLIFSSHVHEFAEFDQGGIHSYITGGLGAPLTVSGPAHAFHHFLQVDQNNDGLHVSVVRFDGLPPVAGDHPPHGDPW